MSSQPEQPTDFVRVGIERSDRMNEWFFCRPTNNPLTEEHVWPRWVSRLLFGKYNRRSRIDSKARKSAHWQRGPHTRTRSGAQDGRILSTAGSDFPIALICEGATDGFETT
jgi:hypothetical protein